MPKELTLTVKASEIPAVKAYIKGLVAERDALAEQNRVLRKAAINLLAWSRKVHAHFGGGPDELWQHDAMDKALSPQPPTASPSAPAECPECGGSGRVSLLADDDGGMATRPCACQSLPAPEAVSGDSERTCATCRWCALSCSGMRYVEPSACSGCFEVPEHPHWEAKP